MRVLPTIKEAQQAKVELRDTVNTRTSHIHGNILAAAAFIYVSTVAVMELAREKVEQKNVAPSVTTIEEVEKIVQAQCNAVLEYSDVDTAKYERYAYECAQGNAHIHTKNEVHNPELIQQSSSLPQTTFYTASVNCYTAACKSWENVCWFVDYMFHYRLSRTQAANRKTLDCNDHSAISCEELSEAGLVPYIHCIWPKDGSKLERWHQFTSCKLDDSLFLINDNQRTILWKGTLEEYATYGASTDLPMDFMPVIGTSTYKAPTYDLGASKFILQLKYATSHEDMEQSGGQAVIIADR